MSGGKDGETAALSAPVNIQAPTMCVGFCYFMLGPSVAKLDLVAEMVHKNYSICHMWNNVTSILHNRTVLSGTFSKKITDFYVSPQRTTELVVWTRSGTETAEWLRAQVTVSLVDTQRVGKISL